VVLAGVDAYNLHEKCFCGEPSFYLKHKNRLGIGFSCFGNFGKGRLEPQEGSIREDKMKNGGWVFLIVSWGLIFGLTALCFIKVFSKKRLK